jgi:hypothetical protein
VQATQSIFTPQQSGYITQDGEMGGTQVIEILRTLSGKAST